MHLGMSDFHRGHQAHFIDAILGSNEVHDVCLSWVGLVSWVTLPRMPVASEGLVFGRLVILFHWLVGCSVGWFVGW